MAEDAQAPLQTQMRATDPDESATADPESFICISLGCENTSTNSTGAMLNKEGVIWARHLEMSFFRKMGVYTKVRREVDQGDIHQMVGYHKETCRH